NTDPQNVRNQADIGGGGLMDIGCYSVSLSRFIFEEEPDDVAARFDFDPEFKTDRLTSAILRFGKKTATFTCSTQLMRYQRVHIYGRTGRIEIEIPFNTPPDRSCGIWLENEKGLEEIWFDPVDQYMLQGDQFSRAIIDNLPVPAPLNDAIANMRVIDALKAAGGWES
ncbi:MAG: gfo/Idh/MocA family oxidoreductase, partial [Spirochaetales bacterium]|nr:gfo/Idh/MocA family oxidoreductase [Spirochaetales bacterium]